MVPFSRFTEFSSTWGHLKASNIWSSNIWNPTSFDELFLGLLTAIWWMVFTESAVADKNRTLAIQQSNRSIYPKEINLETEIAL